MRLFINLVIVILFFVALILFLNSFIPAYKNYSVSVQNKNEALNKLSKTSFVNQTISTLLQKDEIKKIYATEEKGYFDFYLPKKFNDYDLTLLINSIFRSSGFREPNIYQFQKEEVPIPNLENHKILKISFSVTQDGKYDDILNLIKNFENHSRIFTINSLTLTQKENNLIEANINISTFYME
jgi:Tfp pilus assembly protein PilO